MFRFGYGEYMRLAFPKDDLRPISCRGKDSQGGIALTLIDSLDTLIVRRCQLPTSGGAAPLLACCCWSLPGCVLQLQQGRIPLPASRAGPGLLTSAGDGRAAAAAGRGAVVGGQRYIRCGCPGACV